MREGEDNRAVYTILRPRESESTAVQLGSNSGERIFDVLIVDNSPDRQARALLSLHGNAVRNPAEDLFDKLCAWLRLSGLQRSHFTCNLCPRLTRRYAG